MRSVPRRVFLILFLSSAQIGCASSPDDSAVGHTFNVSVEDGVTIARSSAIPKYIEELFTYERIAVLQEDEREESLLVRGEEPSIDERGVLYVPDSSPSDSPSTSRIAVFDSSGVFLYAFGQPGRGPGDMIHPQIVNLDNGIIGLFDPNIRRYSRFTTSGRLIDVLTIPTWQDRFRVKICYRTLDGNYLAFYKLTNIIDREFERFSSQAAVICFTSGLDTLWSLLGQSIEGAQLIQRSGSEFVLLSGTQPFSPEATAIFSESHGILITTGKEPRLDIYDFDGNYKLRIEIDLPLQPVTPEDQKRYEAPIRERMANSQNMGVYQRQLESFKYPDFKTFWGETSPGDIQIDESGFIWLRIPSLYIEPRFDENSILYRVLSPDGEYLGITKMPNERRGFAKVTRGYITVKEIDPETGAIIIVVYRINSAVPGLKYP